MRTESRAQGYTYNIHYSPEQGGYIAHVAEFPALKSGAAATPQAALHALIDDVLQELDQLDDAGEPSPATLSGR